MVKKRYFEILAGPLLVIYQDVFTFYIIRGCKNYLVDSGVSARAEEFATHIDHVLSAVDGDASRGIQELLLTHSHWDHTGASSYLQKRYGFGVIASQRVVELLQKEKVIGFINRLNEEYKKLNQVTHDIAFTGLKGMFPVSGGYRIPVDQQHDIEVIDTPGHTKCSVSYLLHPEKVLFPGDATGVLEQDGTVKPLFLSSYNEYEQSLEKLSGLEAEIIAFPHNRPIVGKDRVKKHMEASLKRTREVKLAILNYLEKEEDIAVIAERLCNEEFPKPTLLAPREALMINMEAMIKAVRGE